MASIRFLPGKALRRAYCPVIGSQSYFDSIVATSPIAYWPLNETSGTAAVNYGTLGTAANGTYSGVTLAQVAAPGGGLAPYFDGVNDLVNLYSAAFAGAFNGQEGSLALWFQVAAEFWADTNYKIIVELYGTSGNDYIGIYKPNSANSFQYLYWTTGKAKTKTASYSGITWTHLGMTWSKIADQFICYLNGGQYSTTITGLGTWASALSSDQCTLGVRSVASKTFDYTGYMAHAAIWDSVLAPATISTLYTGGL